MKSCYAMYCLTSSPPEETVNYPDIEVSDAVIAAVDSGNKIEAIKILREETGLGLAEAKDVVDALVRARKTDAPASGPGMVEEGGAGGMIKMIIAIIIILGVYFYFFAS